MPRAFSEIAYTPSVRAAQQRYGSRQANAVFDADPNRRDTLGEREREFVPGCDTFFMATVGENGWPYVQHRGGPKGFLKILDERTLGFADFSGNRQYISVGNVSHDDRIMLFLIDYARRRRLKVWGRARVVHEHESPELIARLEVPSYRARIERGYLITVEALDFNCPQHITPRYTAEEFALGLAPQHQPAVDAATVAEPLGSGSMDLVVAGIRQLTPRVRAYELHRVGGGELPAAPAGANLSLPVRLDDGRVERRTYSITSDPRQRTHYEIAVQREERGRGGSAAIHRDYALGSRLRCDPPRCAFPLHDDDRPAVLVAGGIGITPLRAMAFELLERQRPFHLHYAARSRLEAPFRNELAARLDKRASFYESDSRKLELDQVFDGAPADAVFYVCGPPRLIDAVLAMSRERAIDPDRIRFERFASAAPAADERAFDVVLKWSGKTLRIAPAESILDAALAAGVDIPYSCRAGSCGTCAVKVIDGQPDHRDSALTPDERDRSGLMCICVSRSRADRLVLDV